MCIPKVFELTALYIGIFVSIEAGDERKLISFFVDKLPERIIIADVATDKWTILNDSVENHSLGIGFGGVDFTISGAVLITCEKGQTDNIKLADDSEVNAQEFIIEYSFDGKIMGQTIEKTMQVEGYKIVAKTITITQ